MLFNIDILSRLHTLPKQLSLLGKRQAAITKTSVLLPLLSSKRSLSTTELSTNDNVNDEFPVYSNKRRKISNSESNLFTKQVWNKYYFKITDKIIIIK